MAEEKDLDILDTDLDIDDDVDLDNVDLTKFGEVKEVFEVPHVKFSTKGFINVLREFKQVCATSGRDVISKAFLIKAGKGKVTFKATDFDTYFETELDCINTEFVCEDDIVVPLDVIIKLVNVLPESTVILKKNGAYFAHVVGGDIVLESYNVDTSKYTCGDTYEDLGSIAATQLSSIIRDLGVLAMAANNTNDRRVLFTKDEAVASYTYSLILSKGNYVPFDLKIKDLKVLSVALTNSDEVLKVRQSVGGKAKRVSVEGEKFKYQFLVSDIGPNEKLLASCNDISTCPGLFIDFIQLSRLVKLAAELPYSVGKVALNYAADDRLEIEIQTKKQQASMFYLAGSKSGVTSPLSKPVVVQAKLLYTLLRSFAHESSINVILTDRGIGVKCDSYSSVLLVE